MSDRAIVSSLTVSKPTTSWSLLVAVVAMVAIGASASSAQDASTAAPPADGSAEPAASAAPAADGTTTDPAPAGDTAATAGDTAPAGETTAPVGEAAPLAGDAATPPPEGAAPVDSALQTADQEYDLRLRELEGKINDLKDSIFRSKAKLTLLTEQVTGGLGGGSGAVILHKNDLGGAYLVTEAHYFLDGQELWQEVDDTGERLTERREYSVFEGNIVEGSHTLTVNVRIQGNGSGIFSYMSGYTWNLKDSYTFTAEPGKRVKISTAVYESGNFTTEINDRPKIKFETQVEAQKKASK